MTKGQIIDVFQRAGKLLYCDKITVTNVSDSENVTTCRCTMWYKKEKHIDEHKRICERLRLHDMLRMGFYGEYSWVSLGEFLPTDYTYNYDLEIMEIEMGK